MEGWFYRTDVQQSTVQNILATDWSEPLWGSTGSPNRVQLIPVPREAWLAIGIEVWGPYPTGMFESFRLLESTDS